MKEFIVCSLIITFCIIAITIVLTICAKFTKRKKLKQIRKIIVGIFGKKKK